MSSANEKLCDAAERGGVAEIERQIAAGADPNALVDDLTPMQWAAARGHVAAIAVLLKAGARVDGVDEDGWTPLMWAAGNGNTAAIDALVAAGADVHHTSNRGNTALHAASEKGQLDAARVLLEAGAKTDVRNNGGDQPIDVVRCAARSLVAAA
jgi:ankyrin repeat protein